MKSIVHLAAIALLAASSHAVVAQDSTTSTTTDTTTAAGTETTGSNYGSLVSTLNAGKMADISTYTDTSVVNCVKVSSLSEASANAAALDNALGKNATAVTDLKTAINANTAFKAKLDTATCPVDDVIAVSTETDGSFTVYIDDRS